MGGCIISNQVCLANNLFRNEVQISLQQVLGSLKHKAGQSVRCKLSSLFKPLNSLTLPGLPEVKKKDHTALPVILNIYEIAIASQSNLSHFSNKVKFDTHTPPSTPILFFLELELIIALSICILLYRPGYVFLTHHPLLICFFKKALQNSKKAEKWSLDTVFDAITE